MFKKLRYEETEKDQTHVCDQGERDAMIQLVLAWIENFAREGKGNREAKPAR